MLPIILKPNYGVIDNDYVKSYIKTAKMLSNSNIERNKNRIPIYYPCEYTNIIKEELPTYTNERYYFNYPDSYFYEIHISHEKNYLDNYEEYERENSQYEDNESTDSEEDFIEV